MKSKWYGIRFALFTMIIFIHIHVCREKILISIKYIERRGLSGNMEVVRAVKIPQVYVTMAYQMSDSQNC